MARRPKIAGISQFHRSMVTAPTSGTGDDGEGRKISVSCDVIFRAFCFGVHGFSPQVLEK